MKQAQRYLLGIEGGGTRLVALQTTLTGSIIRRWESGPANLRLLTETELESRLAKVRDLFPSPDALGMAFAGLRTSEDQKRVERLIHRLWPNRPFRLDHDLACALAANSFNPASKNMKPALTTSPETRVLVLSGTGSCCFGSTGSATAKAGGWGHLLGDRGSAYHFAHQAIRNAVIRPWDHHQIRTSVAARILQELCLHSPEQLIEWIQSATKSEIAALAPAILQAGPRDPLVKAVLEACASELAEDANACVRRLGPQMSPVRFVFAGAFLLRSAAFSKSVRRQIKTLREPLQDFYSSLQRETAWGAIHFAMTALALNPTGMSRPTKPLSPPLLSPIPTAIAPSPTEGRNPETMDLDRLPLIEAIHRLLSEEATVTDAIRTQSRPISKLIQLTTLSLRQGGRIIYVGAGTSGRLGVLDASECPPTFRSDPAQIQGIMAGGAKALWSAVEGAEDNLDAGGDSITHRLISNKDVVIGIAASGRTPFVWGALAEARRRGAATALISCNPNLRFQAGHKPDVFIPLATGPEALTGSTRLKAGTATKIVLNLVTTLTMVRLGKVMSNLMVDLNPSNTKLRDRAIRIVVELTGLSRESAEQSLVQNQWQVHKTVRKNAIKSANRATNK